MLKLSPSTLNLFLDCPLCFWMQFRKGINHPSTIFPSLPSGMDKILKAHFDSYREKGKLPPELHELNDMKLFDDMDLLKVWRSNFKGIVYEDKEVDAILRGAVDDMLVNGEKLVVLDFKTRGFPVKEDTHESYQEQLNIYTFLLEKNGHDTEHYGYLLFYYPNKVNKDGSVLFDTKLVKVSTHPDKAKKLFHDAVKVLQNDDPPEEAEDCEHCRYVKVRN